MNINAWSYIFLIALFASVLIQWLLTQRHVQHIGAHRGIVPPAFADKIPLDAHQRAADYTRAKVRLRLVDSGIAIVLLLLWTLGGGIGLLDSAWQTTGWSPVWLGTGFMLSALAIMSLLDLPMDWYRTFGLEQRFGFNKMTAKTFIKDTLTNALVFLVIGTPLLA
ncbi:MAG: M48 family peptidase, partial [Gammaproteobacteria bacterium]